MTTWHTVNSEVYSINGDEILRHVACDADGPYIEEAAPVCVTHLPTGATTVSEAAAMQLQAAVSPDGSSVEPIGDGFYEAEDGTVIYSP